MPAGVTQPLPAQGRGIKTLYSLGSQVKAPLRPRSLPSWGHQGRWPIHLTLAFPNSQNTGRIYEGQLTCPSETGLGGGNHQPADSCCEATITAQPAQMLQDSQDPSWPRGSEPGHLCGDSHTGDLVRHMVSHPRAPPVLSPPGLCELENARWSQCLPSPVQPMPNPSETPSCPGVRRRWVCES